MFYLYRSFTAVQLDHVNVAAYSVSTSVLDWTSGCQTELTETGTRRTPKTSPAFYGYVFVRPDCQDVDKDTNTVKKNLLHFANSNCSQGPNIARIFKKKISIRLVSVLRGHSVFSSQPQRPMPSDFLSQIVSITFIFLS